MQRAADIVIQRIEQLQSERLDVCIIALDGKSGAGKTTIAKQIAGRIESIHVVCDDFFVGGSNEFWASQSTPYKIDNVIDWRRINREVIQPLKMGTKASWHPFDWKSMRGLSAAKITVEPKGVVLLDGAFSSRKELQDSLDLTVLIRVPEDVRITRISQREGVDYSDRWHATWQDAMDYYFDKMRPPESFDFIVDGE